MTNLTDLQQKIADLLPETQFSINEPMAKHTSFRIGGAVEVMVFPSSVEELSDILNKTALLDCKRAILGAGTNILAPDEGLPGIVICLKDCLGGIEIENATDLRVAAGVTMTRAAVFAANHGLSGLEFAHGIPGTVGGGVYMNAGAYGGEISGVCKRVEVLTKSGEYKCYTGEEMEFSYRHSRLENSGEIVVSAVFALAEKTQEDIRAQMQELMTKRKTSQPLEYPSAGSAFKRPVGGYAAALIDNAGLKGFRIGDAAVSEKHAGFVINLGNATADQVKELLKQIAKKVKDHSGIDLYPEIRIW